MIDQAQIESFRKKFIKEFANENYARFQAVRQKVRDCAAGSAVMKGVSKDDIHKIQEYLIPTERHRKFADEYYRYAQMAAFPGYTESTLLVGMGLLGTGADTIEGVEDVPESFRKFCDANRLMGFRLQLNKCQMLDGGCVAFVQPADPEEFQRGGSPFKLIYYPLDKYVCSQMDSDAGNPFILMDESDYRFDYRRKQYVYENRYRIHALDDNGEYYQAALLAENWLDFDIGNPDQWDLELERQYPNDPQYSRAYYPMFGTRLNFIPVDFCNVTNHTAGVYENPMLSVMSDYDVLIFNADAAYRQTLWLTSQPINVIYGDGRDKKLSYGAGAVHNLDKEFREEWLEFSGAGAAAQEKALNDMHHRAELKAMSLIATGSNISGTALQIIQGSQVAPMVSLVNTSGETMTRLLNYALRWMGETEDKLNYVPSEVFSRMNLSAGDIMSFISLKRSAPDKVPLKWSELRRRLVESGIGDENLEEFDKFMEEVREENEALGIHETDVQRFGDDESEEDVF